MGTRNFEKLFGSDLTSAGKSCNTFLNAKAETKMTKGKTHVR